MSSLVGDWAIARLHGQRPSIIAAAYAIRSAGAVSAEEGLVVRLNAI